MDSGLTFARAWGLVPGVALTAAQMAQLTSDIVWLVERVVTLADGSTQRVLVPQVYVRVRDGDLDASGSLIAGGSVNANLSGDLTNSGSIAGRQIVSLTADNIQNLGGRVSGDAVSVTARTDLNNIGGTITAASSLYATAGRDINNISTVRVDDDVRSTASRQSTAVDRVAGLYVTGANGQPGVLVASAGRDVNLNIQTLQDTSTYDSQQTNAGFGVSLCIPPFCYGTAVTGSVGVGKDTVDQGGPEKTVLHGLSGLIQGKVAGSGTLAGLASGAANELLLPEIQAYLESQGIRRYNPDGTPNEQFNSLLTAAATMVGAASGAATGSAGTGASVALNATLYNRLLHENEKAKIKALANGDADKEQKLNDAACYLTHCAAGKADGDPAKEAALAQEARGKLNTADAGAICPTDMQAPAAQPSTTTGTRSASAHISS